MNFLYDYANHLYGDVDIELVKGYCEYVEKFGTTSRKRTHKIDKF